MYEDIIKYFEKDRFASENGMKLIEVRPGYAVTKMEISERHMNALNSVQGGAIFTLADFAFAAASNSKEFVTVGVNANITYFKPPEGIFLTAKASEISSGRKICSYNIDIFDENNGLIARFTATGYIKKDKLNF